MGQTQKMRSLDGFTLSKTEHGQNMKVPRHEHENPYISLLLLGEYQEESIMAESAIKSGSALFRPKGFEHENEIGSENSFCFNIEIEKELMDENHSLQMADYVRFERNNIEILKIFYGFQLDYSDELLNIIVEENLYHILQHQLTKRSTGRAPWVDKIKKEVRFHPEKHYRIEEVSQFLHLHPNYFVRKFKEKTGLTFGDYLLRQRIAVAVDLMLYSSKNLTEIAVKSGFYDQSHFIRHFKRFFGVSPFQYRAIVKG